MIQFVRNFLRKRSFQVRIGPSLSKVRELENGVPQGTVLSPLLFLVGINSLSAGIRERVQCSLFADDVVLYMRSDSVQRNFNHLQNSINHLIDSACSKGIKFAENKTTSITFTKKRRTANFDQLLIGNVPIPIAEEIKFLGLYWDRKLLWKRHVSILKKSCMQSMTIQTGDQTANPS